MKRTAYEGEEYSDICKMSNRDCYYYNSLPKSEQEKILIPKILKNYEKKYIEQLFKYIPFIKLEKGSYINHATKEVKLAQEFSETKKIWWLNQNFGFQKYGAWSREEEEKWRFGKINLRYRLKKDLYVLYFGNNSHVSSIEYDVESKSFNYTSLKIYNLKKIHDKIEEFLSLLENTNLCIPLIQEQCKKWINKKIPKDAKFILEQISISDSENVKNLLNLLKNLIKSYFVKKGYEDVEYDGYLYTFPKAKKYLYLKNRMDFGENLPEIFMNIGVKSYYYPAHSCEVWFNFDIMEEYLELEKVNFKFGKTDDLVNQLLHEKENLLPTKREKIIKKNTLNKFDINYFDFIKYLLLL